MSITKGKISEQFIYSEELEEDVKLLVYYPANFSPLYKYNVLIAQDGKDYFQLGRIGRVADDLHEKGKIEPTIIIGIPYTSVQNRREKYHPDGAQFNPYVRFLAHELVPYMDEHFPTLTMGMNRALIGDSLGATVSLLTALTYPNTFSKMVLHSPLVNEAVLHAVDSFPFAEQPLDIFHIIGTEETKVETTNKTIEDFLTPNRQLAQKLQLQSSSYRYEEFEGNHTWKYWQKYIDKSLLFLFGKQK